ncbi:hypothetical protein Godav_022768, partial [Gossypium davidsonii]|nr:hypothetical protein [Gossypium davidsonii]
SGLIYSYLQSEIGIYFIQVDGNGRLVPATDDELMEVEGLLENEKRETHIVADTGQALGCISNEVSPSGMPQLESSEGLSQSENTEVDTEKLSAYLEETVPSGAKSSSDDHVTQSGRVGECLKPLDGPLEGGSSTSTGCISSKPDFSKLKGEICLDNLSIKELHEVFKATFGRDTTVKDKLWLKRRIAMGLTNSCDVSATTFVIKDNKLVKKDNEDGFNNVNLGAGKEHLAVAVEYNEDLLNNLSSQIDEHQTTSEVRLGNNVVENNFASEDLAADQRAAKRVRKPTKRYIEELSEAESKEYSGRSIASTKSIGFRPLSSKAHARPARNVSLKGRTVITRLDSLGGFGIQVPYVYRIRRSRPRKNVTALLIINSEILELNITCELNVLLLLALTRLLLEGCSLHALKFHPSGMGMTATFIKKGFDVHGSQMDNGSMNKVLEAKSTPEQAPEQFVAESKKEMTPTDMGQNMGLKYVDPSGDTSDDNVVTVPTAKGGIRRKHHRAWTLSEVMKLVEGVSKYGAGRWSEIKRLAFASYSYRTSVDLKDKWRNLLKASFAQTPTDKGANSRKHPSMPIPASILLRVRELAEMQAQASLPNLSTGKLSACGGGSVNETRPGYL